VDVISVVNILSYKFSYVSFLATAAIN
jgi:hypothetical protein